MPLNVAQKPVYVSAENIFFLKIFESQCQTRCGATNREIWSTAVLLPQEYPPCPPPSPIPAQHNIF